MEELYIPSVSFLLKSVIYYNALLGTFLQKKESHYICILKHANMTTHRSHYLLKIRHQSATVKFETIKQLH